MTPDAKLWMAIVGGTGNVAQDPLTLAGKVIRLNDDGTVPRTILLSARQGFRPEIYTMGHRTAMGLAVNPVTHDVFLSEMGPNGGDETNLLRAGQQLRMAHGQPRPHLSGSVAGRGQRTHAPWLRTAHGLLDALDLGHRPHLL